MTATVHKLHPEQAAKLAPDTPTGKILLALERMAAGVMAEQLQAMFESADDVLFEMAEKARSGQEQQTYMDALRLVRVQRPRMLKSFQDALRSALLRGDAPEPAPTVDLDDLDSWSLQDSSDLEEKIAVLNMVSKADALYAPQLRELEQRMARLSEQASGAVSAKALSSGRVIEAFQHSMKELDLELPIKLVIYKLFDLAVLSRMGKLFAGANEVLDANGLRPPPKAARASPAPPPAGAAFASSLARGLNQGHLGAAMQPYRPGAAATTAPAAVAAATAHPAGPVAPAAAPAAPASAAFMPGMPTTMPPGAAAAPADAHAQLYPNSALATEMLAVMEAVGQGRPVDSWMPAQNLALVSRMFDEMYTDSRLSEATRPMLGRLQFPVMKVALADPTFFSNQQHPVRRLVNDVFDTLTTDGAVSGADFHRLEELLQELLRQFEPDPAKLRQQPKGFAAVSEAGAEQFLQQQKQRLAEQRKNLHEKVRNIVKQELRLHLGTRELPAPAMKLLLSGFGPLLSVRYLKGGPTGPAWKNAVDLLDRVITSFDPAVETPAQCAAREDALHGEVARELTRLGMPEKTVSALSERLREAYAERAAALAAAAVSAVPAAAEAAADAAAPEAAPADAVPAPAAEVPAPLPAAAPAPEMTESVLHLLLRTGEWFRVWDASAKLCRWLQLVQYYEPHDRVIFEDFAGENRLQMKASVFGDDLAAGRSVPVNPSPATTDLIKRLPAVPAEPRDARASWFKPNLRCSPPADGERRSGA